MPVRCGAPSASHCAPGAGGGLPSWQHAERFSPADAVDLEITIDRQDRGEPLALGEPYERGVSQFRRPIGVLEHQPLEVGRVDGAYVDDLADAVLAGTITPSDAAGRRLKG
jgi:hypothetical protein